MTLLLEIRDALSDPHSLSADGRRKLLERIVEALHAVSSGGKERISADNIAHILTSVNDGIQPLCQVSDELFHGILLEFEHLFRRLHRKMH